MNLKKKEQNKKQSTTTPIEKSVFVHEQWQKIFEIIYTWIELFLQITIQKCIHHLGNKQKQNKNI